MKHFIVLLLFAGIIFMRTSAQTPTLNWVNQTGASNSVTNMDVSIDETGNSYVTGFFSGIIDLDPGAGQQLVSTVGSSDIFLAKYDSQGQLVWGKAFGSNGADEGLHIDVQGNSVVSCGFFLTSVTFDTINPNGFLNSFGDFDAYITKYDTSGNFIWAKQVGGFTGIEEARSVCQDAQGNVYITGFFTGQADLDPSNNSLLVPAAGSQDVWIMKLDPNGNLIWVKTLGGIAADQANEIVLDHFGHVLVAGSFRSTVDLDPGTAVVNATSAGFDDAFLLRLDTAGQYLWSATFGNTGSDIMNTIAADANGNMIMSGFFQNTIDADPGPGILLLTTSGNVGGFVIKADTAGVLVFADVLTGTGNNSPRQVKVHSSGHILVAGSFNGSCDFDPLASVNTITSAGSDDAYLLRLDASGYLNWVITYGGAGFEDAQGIAVDTSSQLLVTGRFSGATDFDPGTGVNLLSPAASRDGYVLSLNDQFTTGLLQHDGTYRLLVFPNPVTEEVFIQNDDDQPVSVQLMNLQGQKLEVFTIESRQIVQHSMKNLPSGTYLLQLINTEVCMTQKIVRL